MLLDRLTPKVQVINGFVMTSSQLKVVVDLIVDISISPRYLNKLGSE
jgi:hypothetical protein